MGISGVQIDLFRLIVLNGGRPVSKQSISNLRTTYAKAPSSMVRYLREQLEIVGCQDLIELKRGIGYSASLAGWEVDSMTFEGMVSPLNASLDDLLKHPLSPLEAKRDIETLGPALKAWRANPADGLAEEGQHHYAYFDTLKQKAGDRLLMARLYSGDYGQIREAIMELMARARQQPDIAVWKLLLLAHHAIDSTITNISDLIARQYLHSPPPVLQGLMIDIKNRTLKHNPFHIEGSDNVADAKAVRQPDAGAVDEGGLLKLCSLIGISTTSKLSLTDSHIAPLACIRRTRSRLYFSGVLASKWVEKPDVLSEFNQLLSRLDQEKGEVKFLVINPYGGAFRRLHELRGGRLSTESLVPLKELSATHPSFEVRLFDALPAFRIVSIDDDVLSFSPYRLAAAAYLASGKGWEAPHIVLDPLADYPLAEAFRLLFSETWDKAVPLEQAIPT